MSLRVGVSHALLELCVESTAGAATGYFGSRSRVEAQASTNSRLRLSESDELGEQRMRRTVGPDQSFGSKPFVGIAGEDFDL